MWRYRSCRKVLGRPRQAATGGMPWCLVLASERVAASQFHQLDLGTLMGVVSWWKSGGRKRGLRGAKGGFSDACAWEGTILGEDDDTSLTGDVAFHEILLTVSEQVESWGGEKILPCISCSQPNIPPHRCSPLLIHPSPHPYFPRCPRTHLI